MHAEELWTGTSTKARVLRALLTPASWLYAIGWQCYLGVYRLRFKKPREPHVPVICVGNLLVGGTGKTPATLHVADTLISLGKSVAISCSGYGSPASEAASVAPNGPLKASDWGDEAALIRWLRPQLPLIVGRRRVLAAEMCRRHFPDAVLLLDDGFQHLPLKKHLTLLLNPDQSNRRCLPAGPYREPAGNRKRADLIIGPRAEFHLVPETLSFADGTGASTPAPAEACVLCALGRPRGLLNSLEEAGISLREVVLRPDHDPLTDGNLLSAFPPDVPIVVTGKDWVKLRDRSDVGSHRIVIARHAVHIEPAGQFRSWLEAKLNGISRKEVQ